MRIVVLSGSTGGLGIEILKICGISGIMTIALYRNYNKMQDLIELKEICGNITFAKSDFLNSKTVFDELEGELLQVCPSEITFIHTAYSIEPINKIGDFSDKELLNNVSQNIISPIILFNKLVDFANRNSIKLNILNIDSGAAYRPLNGWSLYSSGKAYLNMFFKSIASENQNIRVVSYEPGVIDTPMQKKYDQRKKVFLKM